MMHKFFRSLAAALVLAAAGGLASATVGPPYLSTCRDAWSDSAASDTCLAGSAFGISGGSITAVTDNCTGQMTSYPFWPTCGVGNAQLQCKIEAKCSTGIAGESTSNTVTEDYPDVDDLINCNGELQISTCP